MSGLTATLQNCVPTFGNCSNPPAGSITTGTTTIKTFTGGTNGSVDTTGNPANNTRELVYSLDPSNSQAIQNIFSVSSAGVMTAGVGQLVQNTTYTVVTRLTDVAGNGEHSTCSITFTFSSFSVCFFLTFTSSTTTTSTIFTSASSITTIS